MKTYEFNTYWLTPIIDGVYSKTRTYRTFERYIDNVSEKYPSHYKSRLCEKYTFYFKGHGKGKPVYCVIDRTRYDVNLSCLDKCNPIRSDDYTETIYATIRVEETKEATEQYNLCLNEVKHLAGKDGVSEQTNFTGILTYSNESNNPCKVVTSYRDIIE